MESIKNNEGKLLYHIQSLTDWHEPVDMFAFANHEPDEIEIRAYILEELSLNETKDIEAIDDLVVCARVYYVYAHTI